MDDWIESTIAAAGRMARLRLEAVYKKAMRRPYHMRAMFWKTLIRKGYLKPLTEAEALSVRVPGQWPGEEDNSSSSNSPERDTGVGEIIYENIYDVQHPVTSIDQGQNHAEGAEAAQKQGEQQKENLKEKLEEKLEEKLPQLLQEEKQEEQQEEQQEEPRGLQQEEKQAHQQQNEQVAQEKGTGNLQKEEQRKSELKKSQNGSGWAPASPQTGPSKQHTQSIERGTGNIYRAAAPLSAQAMRLGLTRQINLRRTSLGLHRQPAADLPPVRPWEEYNYPPSDSEDSNSGAPEAHLPSNHGTPAIRRIQNRTANLQARLDYAQGKNKELSAQLSELQDRKDMDDEKLKQMKEYFDRQQKRMLLHFNHQVKLNQEAIETEQKKFEVLRKDFENRIKQAQNAKRIEIQDLVRDKRNAIEQLKSAHKAQLDSLIESFEEQANDSEKELAAKDLRIEELKSSHKSQLNNLIESFEELTDENEKELAEKDVEIEQLRAEINTCNNRLTELSHVKEDFTVATVQNHDQTEEAGTQTKEEESSKDPSGGWNHHVELIAELEQKTIRLSELETSIQSAAEISAADAELREDLRLTIKFLETRHGQETVYYTTRIQELEKQLEVQKSLNFVLGDDDCVAANNEVTSALKDEMDRKDARISELEAQLAQQSPSTAGEQADTNGAKVRTEAEYKKALRKLRKKLDTQDEVHKIECGVRDRQYEDLKQELEQEKQRKVPKQKKSVTFADESVSTPDELNQQISEAETIRRTLEESLSVSQYELAQTLQENERLKEEAQIVREEVQPQREVLEARLEQLGAELIRRESYTEEIKSSAEVHVLNAYRQINELQQRLEIAESGQSEHNTAVQTVLHQSDAKDKIISGLQEHVQELQNDLVAVSKSLLHEKKEEHGEKSTPILSELQQKIASIIKDNKTLRLECETKKEDMKQLTTKQEELIQRDKSWQQQSARLEHALTTKDDEIAGLQGIIEDFQAQARELEEKQGVLNYMDEVQVENKKLKAEANHWKVKYRDDLKDYGKIQQENALMHNELTKKNASGTSSKAQAERSQVAMAGGSSSIEPNAQTPVPSLSDTTENATGPENLSKILHNERLKRVKAEMEKDRFFKLLDEKNKEIQHLKAQAESRMREEKRREQLNRARMKNARANQPTQSQAQVTQEDAQAGTSNTTDDQEQENLKLKNKTEQLAKTHREDMEHMERLLTMERRHGNDIAAQLESLRITMGKGWRSTRKRRGLNTNAEGGGEDEGQGGDDGVEGKNKDATIDQDDIETEEENQEEESKKTKKSRKRTSNDVEDDDTVNDEGQSHSQNQVVSDSGGSGGGRRRVRRAAKRRRWVDGDDEEL